MIVRDSLLFLFGMLVVVLALRPPTLVVVAQPPAAELPRQGASAPDRMHVVDITRDQLDLRLGHPDALLQALGVQCGDVLQSLDGVPFGTTVEPRAELVWRLRAASAPALDLEVRRAGAPLRIVVLVHPA